MKSETKQEKIKTKLLSLNIGESFDKKEFVNDIWASTDYFTMRSFDVLFAHAKKDLKAKFRCDKGQIIRTV